MSKIIQKTKQDMRERRHARIRAKISGTAETPRLALFRSNRWMYVQLIDDEAGVTIASADTRAFTGKKPMEAAVLLGEAIAASGKEKGITRVVFDRGGFTYTGRVRALADAARAQGLEF